MSWLFYSYNLDVGTALCNPACMVDSTSRLCFHVVEAHIMNDNMQKRLEMLWICGRFLILNGKHENTNPMVLHCWRPVLVITTDKVLAISVLLARLWRSLVSVTRALWSRGTVQLWHSAGCSRGLTHRRTSCHPSAPSLSPDSLWTLNVWGSSHLCTLKVIIHFRLVVRQ